MGFRFEIYAPNFGLKFYLELTWLESLQAEFWLEISSARFAKFENLRDFKVWNFGLKFYANQPACVCSYCGLAADFKILRPDCGSE